MKALVLSAFLLLCAAASAQTPTPQTQQAPSIANYSIMLVSPVTGGGGVVLMHNPKNQLEFVDVAKVQAALAGGYVPVRVAEITDAIDHLRAENERLTAENVRLQGADSSKQILVTVPSPAPASPSPTEIELQRQAQIETAQAIRRQQIIEAWGVMNANRPQPYQLPMPVNPNAGRLRTDCKTTSMGGVTTTSCN